MENVPLGSPRGAERDDVPLTGEDNSSGARRCWKKFLGVQRMSRTHKIIVTGTLIVGAIALMLLLLIKRADDNPVIPVWATLRLPDTVYPEHYETAIQVNLTTFKFWGTQDIELRVARQTSMVILHALSLDIFNVYITPDKATSEPKRRPTGFFYPDNQFYVMQFDFDLAVGTRPLLHLDFQGNLTDHLAGLYRSKYVTDAGETKWMATTQFEATAARRAFPCFDEPSYKANFTITLTTDRWYTALGNMPLKTGFPVDTPDGLRRHEFQTSVRMASYLVAMVVCEFAHIDGYTTTGKLVRVWTQPDKISQAQVALDAGKAILGYYEQYYNYPFPLPKQDLIAIPDFAAGAMENWGLITFRDTALLIDPDESNARDYQRVVLVVAHELAHQWFGDLVTMKWWSDLWLNEGFASYVEYVGTDFHQPTWDMWAQFENTNQNAALGMDSSPSSHPLVQEVSNPNQISELFDAISYQKGASMIYMVQHMIGEDVFMSGLNDYIDKHAFGNAETADLWDAMTKASQRLRGQQAIDVNDLMNAWTYQAGYPVLIVKDVGNGNIELRQQRFIANPGVAPGSSAWDIKVRARTLTGGGQSTLNEFWFKRTDRVYSLPFSPSANGFIKLNANETGFYRVLYPASNWDALERALNRGDSNLSPADRVGILNDVFALANAELIPLTQALNMTRFLTRETVFPVWSTAASALSYPDMMMRATADYDLFRVYVRNLIEPAVTAIGWNTTGPHETRLLRMVLNDFAVRYGVPNARAAVSAMFDSFVSGGAPVPPDFRAIAYHVAVEDRGESAWEFLHARYKTAKLAAESARCLIALSTARERWLLARLLRFSLDPNEIRAQDTIAVIQLVAQNDIGSLMAWEFVQDNWDVLYSRYGDGSFAFAGLISSVTSSFYTKRDYDQVKDFLETKELGSGERAFKASLDRIQHNMKWMSDNYGTLVAWLKVNQPPTVSTRATLEIAN